jgi:hypothetical protein
VKSAFLNDVILEEVFVKQPLGFENPKCPSHVYKLLKALYRLKQGRAWYARLKSFLLEHGYVTGSVDLDRMEPESEIQGCKSVRCGGPQVTSCVDTNIAFEQGKPRCIICNP